MKEKTLIYQDQDSLNSAMLIVCNAEKYALIAMENPVLKDKSRVENNTPAGIAGIAAGLVTFGFLAGVSAGAAGAIGIAATSGTGLTVGLSAIGRLIGGVVVNPMVSGITLLAAAPALIGIGVWYGVRKKVSSDRAKRFDADKEALKTRAISCRGEIKKKLAASVDPAWNKELSEQLALVESVITNLENDTAISI